MSYDYTNQTIWHGIRRNLGQYNVIDILGYIPEIIRSTDPQPVADQIAERYSHGGGYSPFGQGKWMYDPEDQSITYPGDPKLLPMAWADIHGETVIVYRHAMVAIINQDSGNFVVLRMD